MLSTRGTAWSKVGYLHGKPDFYHPVDNPSGIVSFLNAENIYMHDELAEFINKNNHFSKESCAYGEGYTGTLRLRTAMATHLNQYFSPFQPFDAEQITFAAGVTDLNEVCSMLTCDAGKNDSILLGMPIYGPFSKDLQLRTGVKLEYIPVGDPEQFGPDVIKHYETGYEAANARGINIRALIIVNPHNPTGRCYDRETLQGLLRFCGEKKIHLISDEIYALSVYERENYASEKFTSVRSIDPTDLIDPAQVHVFYGMSKDYAAAGMRLGCVISQNTDFTKATRAICRFSSPSQFSMHLASKFLEDRDYVASFLKKSHDELLKYRLLTEQLLDEIDVDFHRKGNSGLYIWVNLSRYLPLEETDGDGWAAEALLTERLEKAGVAMDPGRGYNSPVPGRYRLMYCVPEASLREGMKRIGTALKK